MACQFISIQFLFLLVFIQGYDHSFDIVRAPAPLFRGDQTFSNFMFSTYHFFFIDPIFDGAADPTVIFDPSRNFWILFYTQRKASDLSLHNRSWCFGTNIGIAYSEDMGANWKYHGIAEGLNFEGGLNTFWAPDVIRVSENSGLGSTYHMFVTYIRGESKLQRRRRSWGGEQLIAHYTTRDILKPWTFRDILPFSKVLDPDVELLPGGNYKMWFKDIKAKGQTGAAVSSDLSNWHRLSELETKHTIPHEAPNVFRWRGFYWLLVDPLFEPGILVLRSEDAENWTEQEEKILHWGGVRNYDQVDGKHVDVVVDGNRAYVFYFVHPGRPSNEKLSLTFRQSMIQVAELDFDKLSGRLKCKRDRYAKWMKQHS